MATTPVMYVRDYNKHHVKTLNCHKTSSKMVPLMQSTIYILQHANQLPRTSVTDL